uniref:Putative primase n=1 Tax=viral metagenome TaxID=1070528 RepID=A0A6M3KWE8_9ZZZZ
MSRNLSDWLSGFMELTENSEPPILFRKWAGISTIASALQRKVRVELGISLTFYPNLYIVLVGPSATGKGTAMKFASDIIEQVPSIRLSAQATSLQALIRRMKETNLTDIDLVTGEQQYHSSLTIFSTEFTVFLGYHNKELIAALCEWYDCHSRWSYETIARKKEEIIGVWVNLFAGTTPDSIQASLPIESIGGGLTSRIIFVYEERKGKLVVIPTKSERELYLQQMLVNDLETISMVSGKMSYTEGFLEEYSKWCYKADQNPPFYDRKFDGYCGRRRKHLLSLSMICNASRSDEMVMTVDDLARAAVLLAEVEIKMGMVFKGMGRSDISSLINDAIVFIANSHIPDVPIWQFAKHFEGDMDKWIMERVLTTLETMNLVKIIKRPGADTIIHILEI